MTGLRGRGITASLRDSAAGGGAGREDRGRGRRGHWAGRPGTRGVDPDGTFLVPLPPMLPSSMLLGARQPSE